MSRARAPCRIRTDNNGFLGAEPLPSWAKGAARTSGLDRPLGQVTYARMSRALGLGLARLPHWATFVMAGLYEAYRPCAAADRSVLV